MPNDADLTDEDKVRDAEEELSAAGQAYAALVVLTPAAQGRAFQWLGSRLAAEGMHTRPPYC